MTAVSEPSRQSPRWGWVVWAVRHGLDHVEHDHGLDGALAELRGLADLARPAPAVAWGLAVDGVWLVSEQGFPLEVALSLARGPAAVGLARGPIEYLERVPQGQAARWASRLASSVRLGEVVLRADQAPELNLPRGVGRFDAPTPLVPGAPPLWILRDYRG